MCGYIQSEKVCIQLEQRKSELLIGVCGWPGGRTGSFWRNKHLQSDSRLLWFPLAWDLRPWLYLYEFAHWHSCLSLSIWFQPGTPWNNNNNKKKTLARGRMEKHFFWLIHEHNSPQSLLFWLRSRTDQKCFTLSLIVSKNDEGIKAVDQSLLKCLKHAAPVAHIRTQEPERQTFFVLLYPTWAMSQVWMLSKFETNFLKLVRIHQIRSSFAKLLNLKISEKLRSISTVSQPQLVGSSDPCRGRVRPERRGNVLYIMNIQKGKGKWEDCGKITIVPGECWLQSEAEWDVTINNLSTFSTIIGCWFSIPAHQILMLCSCMASAGFVVCLKAQ